MFLPLLLKTGGGLKLVQCLVKKHLRMSMEIWFRGSSNARWELWSSICWAWPWVHFWFFPSLNFWRTRQTGFRKFVSVSFTTHNIVCNFFRLFIFKVYIAYFPFLAQYEKLCVCGNIFRARRFVTLTTIFSCVFTTLAPFFWSWEKLAPGHTFICTVRDTSMPKTEHFGIVISPASIFSVRSETIFVVQTFGHINFEAVNQHSSWYQ